MESAPPHVLGLSVEELTQVLESRTRALAALRWLYRQGGDLEPVPRSVEGVQPRAWARLAGGFDFRVPHVRTEQASVDGTLKLALELDGGGEVETVLITARGRSTVCVSSQVGCTRNCAFCATARLGFTRNLSAAEMLMQLRLARARAPLGAPLRNVVFMGMGEPMDNLDEVLRAIQLMTQQPEPALGLPHITVSTSGVVPGMRRFLKESRAELALSLNGTTDAQRLKLMPQTRTWPIGALIDVLREEAGCRPDRISFIEYVMLDAVNDTDDDARRLVELLRELPVRVNLIPHNPFAESGLRPSGRERLLRFQTLVHQGGIRCLVRWPRGREIAAACGQLANSLASAAMVSGEQPSAVFPTVT